MTIVIETTATVVVTIVVIKSATELIRDGAQDGIGAVKVDGGLWHDNLD